MITLNPHAHLAHPTPDLSGDLVSPSTKTSSNQIFCFRQRFSFCQQSRHKTANLLIEPQTYDKHKQMIPIKSALLSHQLRNLISSFSIAFDTKTEGHMLLSRSTPRVQHSLSAWLCIVRPQWLAGWVNIERKFNEPLKFLLKIKPGRKDCTFLSLSLCLVSPATRSDSTSTPTMFALQHCKRLRPRQCMMNEDY